MQKHSDGVHGQLMVQKMQAFQLTMKLSVKVSHVIAAMTRKHQWHLKLLNAENFHLTGSWSVQPLLSREVTFS